VTPGTLGSFFDLIHAPVGWACLFTLPDRQHYFFNNSTEMATAARHLDSKNLAVFHSCATFIDLVRKQSHVRKIRCFWLDIDAGPGKFYKDAQQAYSAFEEWRRVVALPPALVVASGGGLHTYFPLRDPLDLPQWHGAACQLRVLAQQHGLHIDPGSTIDAARILRPPGTHNRKLFDADGKKIGDVGGPARPVIAGPFVGPYSIEELEPLFGKEVMQNYKAADRALPFSEGNSSARAARLGNSATPPATSIALGAVAPSFLQGVKDAKGIANIETELPSNPTQIADRCPQVARLRDTKGNLPEPEWYAVLGVLAHCGEPGRKAAHAWSSGDQRYREVDTDAKLDQYLKNADGPTTCKRLGDLVFGPCLKCSHSGKVSSPIQLGRLMRAPPPTVEYLPVSDEEIEAILRQPLPTDFIRSKEGHPIGTALDNYRVALIRMGVSMSYDCFAHREMISGPRGQPFRPLEDSDTRDMRFLIDKLFKFRPPFDEFERFCSHACQVHPFHPVKDYLTALAWDGAPRLDTWLIECGGAEDNEYVRAVSRLIMIAGVRRIMQPGCKFDEMVILESDQGWEKSSALEIIAVKEDWYTDSLPLQAAAREFMEAIEGIWIAEVGELSGMKKAEVEHVKSMMSRKRDRSRRAYARRRTDTERQCVFFGTTNRRDYLRDVTGNRRFWSVSTQRFNLPKLKEIRDQLWAEAVVAEAAGESIRLHENLWPMAAQEQRKRLEEDVWEPLISAAFGDIGGYVFPGDIWRLLDITPDRLEQRHNDRLRLVMKKLGFDRTRRRMDIGGEPTTGFIRGGVHEREFRIMIHKPLLGSGAQDDPHASHVVIGDCLRCQRARNPAVATKGQ
jgi:hypothetical protein